ncbi:TonB-dependent receptor [Marinihelvus fidelis]|uniref:TonB-dependent receptor n=1 Tax=Marinihelvus fidelis TaxID=2613842 RepID=A0A5N0TB56_9GAMM|nr:TonB-dependent receptor [Marinihelvus fidelis]KAA9131971.1 TonB-dependent receptor [Marinihelvus fidelis]
MLSSLIPYLLLQATTTAAPQAMEIVEVRSAPAQSVAGSIPGISTLGLDDIDDESVTHANELLDRVPATWISRGSGQEQLMAIRSPVLTGPGACGAFMVMEDHVSIRPTGFCNVNELFEVNLLQAQAVDVVRGPGSVLYGSNALHGVLDARSLAPGSGSTTLGAGLEVGTDDYYRGRVEYAGARFALAANYTDSGSFRDDESFTQGFLNTSMASQAGGADIVTRLAYAGIDQETAGFVQGKDAWRDPELRTSNQNPEAYRKAEAWRLTSQWRWLPSPGSEFEWIPYARYSDMEFLQHFLPGQPTESNGQTSAGMLFSWRNDTGWSAGIDFEWADGELVEFQAHPTEGSDFLVETRPQGFHYDYEVRSLMAAAWAQYEHKIMDIHIVTAGLRGEFLDYGYRNRMISGNTRDDGTTCGYGGCLYTRPESQGDQFSNLAPELGLQWQLSERTRLVSRIARGFRAPQATELYRLQSGQQVADLQTETLDTAELGFEFSSDDIHWNAIAFAMKKRHFIFRDADGNNVSDGKTRHYGIEGAVDWRMNDQWRLSANAGWAIHEYAFDRPASGIVDGNRVDTAPEWLAGARLDYRPLQRLRLELEWTHVGAYELDPANEHQYEGHDLFALRAFHDLRGDRHRLSVRVTNLFDTYYAERADYAFGNYRYFPGAGRRVYLEWRYSH